MGGDCGSFVVEVIAPQAYALRALKLDEAIAELNKALAV